MGSLVTRNVADLVKKEHFVLDSEYLVTLLVVVPLANINDWNNKYEKLTDMIVPRSSQLIYQVGLPRKSAACTPFLISRTMTMLSCQCQPSTKLWMSSSRRPGRTSSW